MAGDEEVEYLLQKKRLALVLGFAALGGVAASLLLKFYAGLAVVTAAVPPAAIFTLAVAAAVTTGVLVFAAIKGLRAYRAYHQRCSEALFQQKFDQDKALEEGGEGVVMEPEIRSKNWLRRVADGLYGPEISIAQSINESGRTVVQEAKFSEGISAFCFLKKFFSRSPSSSKTPGY